MKATAQQVALFIESLIRKRLGNKKERHLNRYREYLSLYLLSKDRKQTGEDGRLKEKNMGDFEM